MKQSTFWMLTGVCVASIVPVSAIAQSPDYYNPASGVPDYEGPANRMMDNYINQRQNNMMMRNSGILKDSDSSNTRKSPRTQNTTRQNSTQGFRSGSPIAPRMMAASYPEGKRGDMEKLYTNLLKLYPVSAKRFGIAANNNHANVAAVFVCSNMQVISQQPVSPDDCIAVSGQMKRLFSNSNSKYARLDPKTKQVSSEYMAIVATSMNVVFEGMQTKPNPQMQASAAAQASAELQKVLGVPGTQLQITSRGLSKK